MGKGFLFDIRIEDSFEQENGAISVQNGVFDAPLAVLSKTAICMFWYLATKRAGDRFCVSKPDFMEKFPATSERQYYSAMQELIDVGYMKQDGDVGFYNFNPNVEIEPIKKREKSKLVPRNYLEIFISVHDIPFEPCNRFERDKWYILPANCIKRGNEKDVYFCKCLGRNIPKCIGILITNFGFFMNGDSYDAGLPFKKNSEYAYILIANRALPVNEVGGEEILNKIPNLTCIDKEGTRDDEGILWEDAKISKLPKICRAFEKNGIHNLGAIEMEQEGKSIMLPSC